MTERVRKYIGQHQLLQPTQRILVALSGGADSVVLLHLLKKLGYPCSAAHCNFHLRAEESDRDQAFVTRLAAQWNIPLHTIHFDTKREAQERKISIEMAARTLRYDWFEELRKEHSYDCIALAHHQDDSVETMLINLIRGTGIRGLTGISARNGFLVRPLLCVTKEEILQYTTEHQLNYVTDSSNMEDEYVRNKIRLHIIPELEKINPSLKASLQQTIDNLSEVEKIYDAHLASVVDTLYNKEKQTIDIVALKKLPSPEAVLFELLRPFAFNRTVIADVWQSADTDSGKRFYSPTHLLLKDRNEWIIAAREKDDQPEEYVISEEMINEGRLPLALSVESYPVHAGEDILIKKQPSYAYLDADKLTYPLVLRKWRTGDRFKPLGMTGFQKVSDYFNNHKFTLFEKENTWLLISGNNIAWIVNHRIDDRFKITNKTGNVCLLKVLT